MLNFKRILATAAIVATFVTASIAASPVGSWTGRIVLDKMPAIPANTPPEQKKMINDMISKLKLYRIAMVVKGNKSFTITAPPMPMMGDKTGNKAEGTWKQSGTKVTFTTTKDNGKAPVGENAKPKDATLSADGKTLTFAVATQGKLVFTKK